MLIYVFYILYERCLKYCDQDCLFWLFTCTKLNELKKRHERDIIKLEKRLYHSPGQQTVTAHTPELFKKRERKRGLRSGLV